MKTTWWRRLIVVGALGFSLGLGSTAKADVVGAWLFNEGAGTSAGDSSGNGLTGTIRGNPQWLAKDAGMFGSALRFEENQYVDFGPPTPPALLVKQDISFMAWVRPTRVVAHWQVMFSLQRGSSGGEAYAMTYGNNDDQLRAIINTAGGNAEPLDPTPFVWGEWIHAAATYNGDKIVLYRNGKPVAENSAAVQGALNHENAQGRFAINGNYNSLNGGLGEYAVCTLDELVIFDEVVSQDQIEKLMTLGFLNWRSGPGAAQDPAPKDRATDVPFDTTLSWTPGEFAATHDVYFGKTFADVNDATRTNPKGVLAGQGQTAAEYEPTALEFGQTYYWRVDEVNKAPDNTIFKGNVWSFTTEPYAYPLPNVTATASSFEKAANGPQNTVDGSGLTGDLHSTAGTAMWVSSMAGPTPPWIQYQFDRVYQLHELWVWNHNTEFEPVLGYGCKDVTVEYSTDGTTWALLKDVQFAQATAQAGYAYNTTVDFGGVLARYVRLTAKSNWSKVGLKQYGLSEVRFFYVPLLARAPQPANAATGIGVDTGLSWRPGRAATSHQVFFGTDPNAVAQGTAPAKTVTEHSYAPGALNYGTKYYWKVDEVGAAATYPGDVWNFSTANFAVVDDFESYTDKAGGEIYTTWVDGYGTTTNGSQVGYVQAPFAEKTIIHGGTQSMPLAYDNAGAGKTSEATRTFDAAQDWTAGGLKSLSLWFYGDPANAGQLYLKINNTKVSYNGPAADLKRKQWQPWNIDLSTIGGSVSNVTKLTIGVEGAGATGKLYLDDIRLYPRTPEMIIPVDPGKVGLLAEYLFDNGANDTSGKSHHGTFQSNAHVADSVLVLDGVDDAVAIPQLGGATATHQQCTYSMWMYSLTAPASSGIIGGINFDNWSAGGIHCKFFNGRANAGINGLAGGDLNGTTIVGTEEWAHLALTVTDKVATIYLNGQAEASRAFNTPLTMILGKACIGAWNNTGDIQRELKGRMDDVRIYNRAVSPEEMLWLAGRKEPVHKPF